MAALEENDAWTLDQQIEPVKVCLRSIDANYCLFLSVFSIGIGISKTLPRRLRSIWCSAETSHQLAKQAKSFFHPFAGC